MQYNETLYAFVYLDKWGLENPLNGHFEGEERPFISNCSEEITRMSYDAITIAERQEVRIKLVKYQKEHEVDFSYFVNSPQQKGQQLLT